MGKRKFTLCTHINFINSHFYAHILDFIILFNWSRKYHAFPEFDEGVLWNILYHRAPTPLVKNKSKQVMLKYCMRKTSHRFFAHWYSFILNISLYYFCNLDERFLCTLSILSKPKWYTILIIWRNFRENRSNSRNSRKFFQIK